MKNLFLAISILLSPYLYGQTEYMVAEFSDRYTAKVYCKDIEENLGEYGYPVEIKIYDKLTEKEIINVVRESNMENEFSNLEEGAEIESNVNNFPTGEGSIIISGDFNCDGFEDLAIQTDYYWMHFPSYVIYLFKDGELVEDEEWTNLIATDCGMFKSNCETKTLKTYCYIRLHSETESRYSIEDGSPFLLEQTEMMHTGTIFPHCNTTTWTPSGYEYKMILADEDFLNIVFRLKLADIDREIILLNSLNDLFFCVIDSNNVIDSQLLGDVYVFGEFWLTKTETGYNLCFELDTPKFEIIWTDAEINIHTLGENNQHVYKGIYPEGGIQIDEVFNAEFDNLIKQN